jgi:ribosomal protein S2
VHIVLYLTAMHCTHIIDCLYSMGSHIGHLHVEAYDGLSYYLLGIRNFFTVSDVHKTISLLKNALLFYECLVSNYGHALFCYSNIESLNMHVKFFFIKLICDRSQSFSY